MGSSPIVVNLFEILPAANIHDQTDQIEGKIKPLAKFDGSEILYDWTKTYSIHLKPLKLNEH